jgi:hypothetical protein
MSRGAYGLKPTDRARLIAGTDALMHFGPRVIAELLLEVAEIEPLLNLLDHYARIAVLAEQLGGADWTPPIRAATRGRRAA